MFNWIRNKNKRHEVLEKVVAEGLALQFKMLRKERGMTQIEFADFLGWAQPQVSRYETYEGMRNVSLETLFHIASKCDVALVCRFISWSSWVQMYFPMLPIDPYSDEEIDVFITSKGAFARKAK